MELVQSAIMKSIAAISLLLSLIIGQAIGQCLQQGECELGRLIGASVEVSSNACLAECKKTYPCNYFTYSLGDGFCGLYETCPDIDSVECEYCVTGEKSCPLMTCNTPGVCTGAFLHREVLYNAVDCENYCYNYDEDCRFYAYSDSNHICLLFATCPAIQAGGDEMTDAFVGEPGCLVHDEAHWVMVVGGFLENGDPTESVDLVSLDPINHPVPECLRTLRNHIGDYGQAAGAMLKKDDGIPLPVVCGGAGSLNCNPRRFRCEAYDVTGGNWYTTGDMPNDSQCQTGFNVLPETRGLVITGGGFGATAATASTTNGSVFDTQTIPQMPFPVNFHCLVALQDRDTVISIGGTSSEGSRKVFSCSPEEGNCWQEMSDTAEDRVGSGCGFVKNSDMREWIVVAGGEGSEGTTEVINLSTGAVKSGPKLPANGLRYPGSVQYGNTFALVGGTNDVNGPTDAVYLYNPEREEFVEVAGETLSSKRYHVTAFLVSSKIFREC